MSSRLALVSLVPFVVLLACGGEAGKKVEPKADVKVDAKAVKPVAEVAEVAEGVVAGPE